MASKSQELRVSFRDQCPFDRNSGLVNGCHRQSLEQAQTTLDRLKEKSEQLEVIHDLALLLLQRSSLDDIVWLVARSTIARLGFEDCVIYLIDEAGEKLVQKAAFGPKNPYGKVILDPIVIPVGEGIVGSVAATGIAQRISDTRQDSRYIVDDQMRLSELAVPMILHGDKVIGVIDSEHSEADFYTNEHVELLTTIASIAANKIDNAMTIGRLNITVSELRTAQELIALERERYRVLYDHHPSMFFVLDTQGVIRSVNDFAQKELGFQAHDMIGRPLCELGPDEEQVRSALSYAIATAPTAHRWETRRQKRGGKTIWVRDTARILASDVDSNFSVLVV